MLDRSRLASWLTGTIVPLEVVKKTVEEEAKREETTESGRGTMKKELQQLFLATSRANEKGGRT
jgi:hypothetical protein